MEYFSLYKGSEYLLHHWHHQTHEYKLLWTLRLMWLSLCFLTAVQPVPYPFLLPCCLPKPIPTSRALHGHFPFICAPARPGANPREHRESGLPPLASALPNCWQHKSPAGWDLNHISRSLFGGAKQTETRGEERRAGNVAQIGEREWGRGTNYNRWTSFPPQISHMLCVFFFSSLYSSLLFTAWLCIYYFGPWLYCVYFFIEILRKLLFFCQHFTPQ